MPPLSPVDLCGWIPVNSREHDNRNDPWVEDSRFSRLAEFQAYQMMRQIAPWIGWSNVPSIELKVNLHKKIQDGIAGRAGPFYLRESPSKPNGYATYKRYVQLAPWNYHANYCQFYIESFFEGADAKEDPNSKKPYLDPMVQPDEMVSYVGIYCGREEMLEWNSKVEQLQLDEYDVYAHHDRVNELIHELSKIDCSNFSEGLPFVYTDDEKIRFRIQLPRQSLNQGNWNPHLELLLKEIMNPVLVAFTDIALNRIDA
jgi:hypothetical protein